MKIVLASGSRWRQQMLRSAGIPCEIDPADIDEAALVEPDPIRRALALARAKAEVVAARHPDAVVVGADQVAHLDGEIFGKPPSAEAQRARLCSLRGRRHELVTGVSILGPGLDVAFHEITGMRFRADVSDAEIDAYVATGEGRGCAGGYQLEGLGAQLVEAVEGDWFNVIGLPLLRLIGALRAEGWRPFDGEG